MKRMMSRPLFFWTVVILAYLASLALCVGAVSFFPVAQQRNSLTNIADTVADKYIGGDLEGEVTDARHLIYDGQGNLLMDIIPVTPWEIGFSEEEISRILSQVYKGEKTFNMFYENSQNDLVAIAAVPIYVGENIEGASIVIRNIKNLPESVEGIAIIYTALYIVFIFILISIRRKKKYLEILEKNYVSNVTHALKSPISSIKALAEALVDVVPCEPDKQQPYFGMILNESNISIHMIQEILDLSKLQSGGASFSKRRFAADDALGDIFRKYTALCECMQIPFSVSEGISSLPKLRSDEQGICQVMEILLENALKYVNKFGEGIVVSAKRRGRKAVFCVWDDGSIISKEDLPNVFERFYIGKNSEGKNSTGLGLSIAKAIIKHLNEDIWIESCKGKGTSAFFTVTCR